MNQNLKIFLRKHPVLYRLVSYVYDMRPLDLKFRKAVQESFYEIGLKNVRFVQIGANDGGVNNPFASMIRTKNIEAIMVEPVPHIFERLAHNFAAHPNVTVKHCAVTPNDGEDLNFYWVCPKAKTDLGDLLPPWWDQLGSFDRRNIVNHLDGVLEPYIMVSKVPSVSISEFMKDHEDTNFLALDCEGYDYRILRSYCFRVKPRVLLFEYKHMTTDELSDLTEHLGCFGYRLQLFRNDAIAKL